MEAGGQRGVPWWGCGCGRGTTGSGAGPPYLSNRVVGLGHALPEVGGLLALPQPPHRALVLQGARDGRRWGQDVIHGLSCGLGTWGTPDEETGPGGSPLPPPPPLPPQQPHCMCCSWGPAKIPSPRSGGFRVTSCLLRGLPECPLDPYPSSCPSGVLQMQPESSALSSPPAPWELQRRP